MSPCQSDFTGDSCSARSLAPGRGLMGARSGPWICVTCLPPKRHQNSRGNNDLIGSSSNEAVDTLGGEMSGLKLRNLAVEVALHS